MMEKFDARKRVIGFLRNSRSNSKVAALVSVFLVSFSLYGLYCINTVSEVKINGPYYDRIIQGKDVIADILPPPEYLIETYLAAYQLLHAGDRDELDSLVTMIAKLKADYVARHRHWDKELPEDEIKTALVKDAYEPGMRMLAAVENGFIPALRAGDRERAAALLAQTVRPEYLAHRAGILKVVALAVKRNQEDEARAAVAVHSRTFGQIILGILLFFLLSIFSTFVIHKVESEPILAADPEGKPQFPPFPPGAAPTRESGGSGKPPSDRTRA